MGALVLCGIVSFTVTPLTARLARRFGILDHPDDQRRKAHLQATPYLGGIAIFAGLGAGAPLLALLSRRLPSSLAPELFVGSAIAIGLGVIGLLDDVRPMPRSFRLGAQVAAALGAWAIGFRVAATPWELANVFLTVFWIVGITNAFNLLDNMDGLSAGIAGIAAFSFGVLGFLEGLFVVTLVSAGLTGACLGFLAHNRHPAKIFMGDAGSLFLGFLLAIIGIQLRFDNLLKVTFLVPVLVLGIPILDTTLVVLSRLRHRRPVFLGGRDHISHRLVHVGLPVRAAVALLYWAGLCLGWLGLVVSRSNVQVGWMLLAFVIAVGIFFGALLWRVPVYAEQPGLTPLPEEAVDPDELVTLREAR